MAATIKGLTALAVFAFAAWRGWVFADSTQDGTAVGEALLVFTAFVVPVFVIAMLVYGVADRIESRERVVARDEGVASD